MFAPVSSMLSQSFKQSDLDQDRALQKELEKW